MTTQAKRKAKELLIASIKKALALNGYSETRHGKFVGPTGDKRFVFGGNNLKIQRKTEEVLTSYDYKIPARWVNTASAPYAHIELTSQQPLKLKIDRKKTYGNLDQ